MVEFGDDLAATVAHPSIAARSTADMAEHLRTHFDVARFDEWVITAQPGGRQIYGAGRDVTTGCAPMVAARMRALADAGLVRLFQPRRIRPDGDTGHPFDFVAIRTEKPVPKGFPQLPPVAAKPRAPVVVKLPKRGGEE